YQYTAATGTATTTDGAGTWSTASANWRLNNAGTAVNWANSPVQDATVGAGGAGGTITVSSVTVGNLTFPTVTSPYTLSASTLTFSGTPTVTVNNSGGATISSALSGGFLETGAGTLTLGDSLSSYTGPITITSGT